jgi:hypothetical protein
MQNIDVNNLVEGRPLENLEFIENILWFYEWWNYDWVCALNIDYIWL